MRIAHCSDIHFGRIEHPDIVDALQAAMNTRDVDLVVVSGDLTQRAFAGQYRAARAFLDRLQPPTLVVPGNHDVYPWWRPFARLMRPIRRYQRYIDEDLYPTFEQDDVAVLGLCSAHGATVKGGRLGTDALATMQQYFARVDAQVRVLVIHHHLTQLPGLPRHDVMRQADVAREAVLEAGVDLVLTGHLHISHVEVLPRPEAGRPLVIASAGTATSNRGRGAQRDVNYYNEIDITPDGLQIAERRFDLASRAFVTEHKHVFEAVGS